MVRDFISSLKVMVRWFIGLYGLGIRFENASLMRTFYIKQNASNDKK